MHRTTSTNQNTKAPPPPSAPEWLDRTMYPFSSNWFDTGVGRIHYVDEGGGEPIVFVHGNPSWSFEYRHQIKALSASHRCIAPDHLGFGLSDKPNDWSYRAVDHAANLAKLLDHLNVERITVVVNDWGGPIGLSYAISHPDRVKRIVITNSWMWSVRNDWYYQGFSRMMGGPIGRHLVRHRNYFARTILPKAFGDRSRLSDEVHRHYLGPLDTASKRTGCMVLPAQIVQASDWLASLWQHRTTLRDHPMLIVWGERDIAFRMKELRRWTDTYRQAEVIRLADVGHFPAEEAAERFTRALARFVDVGNP